MYEYFPLDLWQNISGWKLYFNYDEVLSIFSSTQIFLSIKYFSKDNILNWVLLTHDIYIWHKVILQSSDLKKWFSVVGEFINQVYFPIFIPVGVLGNILSFLVGIALTTFSYNFQIML